MSNENGRQENALTPLREYPMKNAFATACLLAGILFMGLSFCWDRLLEPPLTEDDMAIYQRNVNIREHILMGSAQESDRLQANQIAEEMKAKVRRREQRKENGEFLLTSVGVILSLIGIAIVVSSKSAQAN
jgi:hypothetical protein